MGLRQRKLSIIRMVTTLFMATALLAATGCFSEKPQAVVRLQADGADSLTIGIDEDGWYVSLGTAKATHVTQQIVVEVTAPKLLIVWQNNDDRYHEIMFHRDHAAHDAIDMNPGERVAVWVDNDFERYVHSHHAPEMPELYVRVEPGSAR